MTELVLTILSQNTSDANSGRAFLRLRTRFPTWEELMAADPDGSADADRAANSHPNGHADSNADSNADGAACYPFSNAHYAAASIRLPGGPGDRCGGAGAAGGLRNACS